MAENEGMEEKDFAKQEKIKEQFEKVIMQIINEMENDNAVITLEGTDININIKREKEVYQISLLGKNIATVDKNKDISYNIEELENIKKTLENGNRPIARYEDLGLPDIEYLKELEKDREKENKIKNADEEKEEKEEDEEKPDLEEKDNDKDEEEIAREYNVSSKDVIHIKRNDSKKVTEHETFSKVTNFDDKYKDIYIIRGKDSHSWKAIGADKDGKKEEIKNEQDKQIGGKNPDITIKKVGDSEIKEITPLAVFKIDSKTAYAIARDEQGKSELIYCRKQGGNEKEYWGIKVPEANNKNTIQESADAREFLDHRNNSGQDLSRKADALTKAQNLEKRGVPTKEKGVQEYEIERTPEQNRALAKEQIKEDLYKRMEIKEKMKGAMPGYLDYIEEKIDNQAEKILRLLEENDSITYEEAVERVQKDSSEREQGGRTPDQGQRKRGE